MSISHRKEDATASKTDQQLSDYDDEDDDDDDDTRSNAHDEEKEKKLREIRAQIEAIKQQIEGQPGQIKSVREKRLLSRVNIPEVPDSDNLHNDSQPSSSKKNREQETLDMIKRFKKRLKNASREPQSAGSKESSALDKQIEQDSLDDLEAELADLHKVDGDDWLMHKFEVRDDDTSSHERDDRGSGHSRKYSKSDDRRRQSSHNRATRYREDKSRYGINKDRHRDSGRYRRH